MKKYKKVTDIEVLKKYNEILSDFYEHGCWIGCIPIEILANKLNTSKYQINKAYKSLKEKKFIKLEKIGTYFADYDNGLYCEEVPVLYTKAYVMTTQGRDFLKEMEMK